MTTISDSLACGVNFGGNTFSIDAMEDGTFRAVHTDENNWQTTAAASGDDWNELLRAWRKAGADYGDAARVVIAARLFRSRGWIPADFRMLGLCD
jgi:hypothetical protein